MEVADDALACPHCTRSLTTAEAMRLHRRDMTPEERERIRAGWSSVFRVIAIALLIFAAVGGTITWFMLHRSPGVDLTNDPEMQALRAAAEHRTATVAPPPPPKPADDADLFITKYGAPDQRIDAGDTLMLLYTKQRVRATYARDAQGAWRLVAFADPRKETKLTAAQVRARMKK